MATIYILTNIENGKQYIGKTMRSFNVRLSEHLSHTKHNHNISYLHNAIRKYGIENFHIECLTVSDKLVDLWEKHLIKRWAPEYNLSTGGEGRCGLSPWNKGIKWKDRMGKDSPVAKRIILTHPNGAEEYFDCMMDACRKYDLNKTCLSKVALGIKYRKNHKGYKARYIYK